MDGKNGGMIEGGRLGLCKIAKPGRIKETNDGKTLIATSRLRAESRAR